MDVHYCLAWEWSSGERKVNLYSGHRLSDFLQIWGWGYYRREGLIVMTHYLIIILGKGLAELMC